jgi:hypothetical protein
MSGDKLESTLLIDGLKADGLVETAGHILNPVIQQSHLGHESKPVPKISHAAPNNHKLLQPQRRVTAAFLDPFRHAVHDQGTQIDHQDPSIKTGPQPHPAQNDRTRTLEPVP